MDYSDLLSYFNQYVEQNAAFRESESYQTIINFLETSYLRDTYCNIPSEFKLLYEYNIIPSSLYDTILLSAGFPQYIIDQLTLSDKEILIRDFLLFNAYKSSVDFVIDIASKFNNKVNIYELYIDRINDHWCFVAYPIYLDKSLIPIDTPLNYEYIYYKTKNYYLSSSMLEQQYQSGDLILPIKSNLILLDFYLYYTQTKVIDNLINMTTLSQFGDNEFDLYFSFPISSSSSITTCTDSYDVSQIFDTQPVTFKISLYGWYKLYYYIILSYYKTVYNMQPIMSYPIIHPNDAFPYRIEDLDPIINEYLNIKYVTDATAFYKSYIQTKFKTDFLPQQTTITYNDLKTTIQSDIDPKIIEYIDYRLQQNIVNIDTETNSILDEMIMSLKTYYLVYIDQKYKKYFDKFIDFLPTLTIPLEKTQSYLFMNEFKPFHTELVNSIETKIVSDDLLNTITPSDNYHKSITQSKSSIVNISDNDYNFDITTNFHDQVLLKSVFNNEIYLKSKDNIFDLSDNYHSTITQSKSSLVNISDNDYKFNTISHFHDNVLLKSLFNNKIYLLNSEENIVTDEYQIHIITSHASNITISEDYNVTKY
jgi:hypothetical protein